MTDNRYAVNAKPMPNPDCPACGPVKVLRAIADRIENADIPCPMDNDVAAAELVRAAAGTIEQLNTRCLTLQSLLQMVIDRSWRDTDSLASQLREAMQ